MLVIFDTQKPLSSFCFSPFLSFLLVLHLAAPSAHDPGLSLPSGLLGIASFVLRTPFLPFFSGVPDSLLGKGPWLALSLFKGEGLDGILDELLC